MIATTTIIVMTIIIINYFFFFVMRRRCTSLNGDWLEIKTLNNIYFKRLSPITCHSSHSHRPCPVNYLIIIIDLSLYQQSSPTCQTHLHFDEKIIYFNVYTKKMILKWIKGMCWIKILGYTPMHVRIYPRLRYIYIIPNDDK